MKDLNGDGVFSKGELNKAYESGTPTQKNKLSQVQVFIPTNDRAALDDAQKTGTQYKPPQAIKVSVEAQSDAEPSTIDIYLNHHASPRRAPTGEPRSKVVGGNAAAGSTAPNSLNAARLVDGYFVTFSATGVPPEDIDRFADSVRLAY